MGGVYRIQTFFGFLYFFCICKAPKYRVKYYDYLLINLKDKIFEPAVGSLPNLARMCP